MSELAAFWQAELQRFIPDPAKALGEAQEYVCCPICQVLAGLPFGYFSVVSGRWPEDPDLRTVVIAAGGFCNHHTYILNGMQSNVAIARVFVDVLAALAEHPGEVAGVCAVCHLEQMATETLLGLLVARLQDEAERTRFGELFGLCYPHWRALWAMDLPAPLREFLWKSQNAYAKQLQGHLQGFLDKNTIELKWTRSQDEMRAARRALVKTAGNEGV